MCYKRGWYKKICRGVSLAEPPKCITGVMVTGKTGINPLFISVWGWYKMPRKCTYKKVILVDWLRFTVGLHELMQISPKIDIEDENELLRHNEILGAVKQLLGLTSEIDFSDSYGLYRYKVGYILGGIRVCWDGNDNTLMVDISGEGCRLLETLVPSLDWLMLIRIVSSVERFNFSRLDVACDTYDLLDMDKIFKFTMEGRYVQLWNLVPLIRWGREQNILFGSKSSNVLLRIYNKTYERQCKSSAEDIPPNWVRCEFELSNRAVDSFVREWEECGDISKVYFGLMVSHLRFVKKLESNVTRSETVSWWGKFIDNSEPIKLAYKGGLEYNLQSLQDFLFNQCGSSIHAYLKIVGGDVSELVERASRQKLNPNQNALVSTVAALKEESFGFGCECMERIESKLDFEKYLQTYGEPMPENLQLRGKL